MQQVRQEIVRFYLDEENDWVAEMACGHTQHMRHNPPWQNRSWVITESGQQEWLGTPLVCKECTEQTQ